MAAWDARVHEKLRVVRAESVDPDPASKLNGSRSPDLLASLVRPGDWRVGGELVGRDVVGSRAHDHVPDLRHRGRRRPTSEELARETCAEQVTIGHGGSLSDSARVDDFAPGRLMAEGPDCVAPVRTIASTATALRAQRLLWRRSAAWAIRSATLGMPSTLVPCLLPFLGISTARIVPGKYDPDDIRFHSR